VSPGPITVLYDGACSFCTSSAEALARRLGPRRVQTRDFQLPGVLDDYPGVTREAAMRQMHAVLPDGRVFAGAEAAARIASRLRPLGWLAWVYFIPGVRQLANLAYALVARHRYRLFGRRTPGAACKGDACSVHGGSSGQAERPRTRSLLL
jgi:predicted DCC family thiol-disulfide oxidoreductase YuxK